MLCSAALGECILKKVLRLRDLQLLSENYGKAFFSLAFLFFFDLLSETRTNSFAAFRAITSF